VQLNPPTGCKQKGVDYVGTYSRGAVHNDISVLLYDLGLDALHSALIVILDLFIFPFSGWAGCNAFGHFFKKLRFCGMDTWGYVIVIILGDPPAGHPPPPLMLFPTIKNLSSQINPVILKST